MPILSFEQGCSYPNWKLCSEPNFPLCGIFTDAEEKQIRAALIEMLRLQELISSRIEVTSQIYQKTVAEQSYDKEIIHKFEKANLL
jgi:hypothetical protein